MTKLSCNAVISGPPSNRVLTCCCIANKIPNGETPLEYGAKAKKHSIPVPTSVDAVDVQCPRCGIIHRISFDNSIQHINTTKEAT